MIDWLLPLQLVSPNVQQHWTKRHKRNKRNAALVVSKWNLEARKPQPPCVVLLDRLYCSRSKPMDEDDNLRMAFKGIKDAIADLIVPGLQAGRADDAIFGISWRYSQTTAKMNGVRITIKEGWLYEGPAFILPSHD